MLIIGMLMSLVFMAGVVFFFIGLVGSIKKTLTVYYDASDALISLVIFSIVSFGTSFFIVSLYRNDEYPQKILDVLTFKEPINLVVMGLLLALILNIAFIVYSFYMSYIYNRHRKGFVIAAFMGRCSVPYFLTLFLNFIIIFVLGASTSYINLQIATGFGGNIIVFLGVTLILLLAMLAFIRRFKFSDFSNYFNFKYLSSLSDDLEEEYKKLEYHAPKQNIEKKG